jgi:hypothetical protein
MHGHGYTQPVKQPPPTLWLIFLRVVFVALSIISFGFLAWVMLLRLAIVTRKLRDWLLLGALILIDLLAVVLLGSEPDAEIHTVGGWLGLLLLLGSLTGAIAYYIAADVRHYHQLRHGAYAAGQTPIPGHGYPRPPAPYTATTAPQTPAAPHHPPPMPQATPTDRPPIPAPPQRPAPARIDQVRAELDELSDYLRKHDGNHEGGR